MIREKEGTFKVDCSTKWHISFVHIKINTLPFHWWVEHVLSRVSLEC